MLPPILTLEQAAEYLQLEPDELKTELEAGRLPGTKIAGKWRIKQESLDKLFDLDMLELETLPSSPSEKQSDYTANEEVTPSIPTTTKASLPETTTISSNESSSVPLLDDKPPKQEDTPKLEPLPSSPPERQSHRKSNRETITSTSTTTKSSIPVDMEVRPQQLTLGAIRAQARKRLQGEVYAYNRKQKFGYARLLNNQVVWLDPQHFLNPNYIPQLGDEIEFKLVKDHRGSQAQEIVLVSERAQFLPKISVSPRNQSTAVSQSNQAKDVIMAASKKSIKTSSRSRQGVFRKSTPIYFTNYGMKNCATLVSLTLIFKQVLRYH